MSSLEERIGALLAVAESESALGYPEASSAFREKALKMMRDHAIDMATVAAKRRTRRAVETGEIPGGKIPRPYQSAHAGGMTSLCGVLGGYSIYYHWRTDVSRVVYAIDAPEAFARLVVGLASICAAETSVRGGSRLQRSNYVRGFWYGCCVAAKPDPWDKSSSKVLVLSSESARRSLLGDSDIKIEDRPVKIDSREDFWSGSDSGTRAYRSFGHEMAK